MKNVTGGRRNGPFRQYRYRRLSSIENGECSAVKDNDDDEDEASLSSDNVEMELHKVGRTYDDDDQKNDVRQASSSLIPDYEHIVERPIIKGETLSSLSLKYRIPVAELKRINKLHQETEFYALTSLKIPVKPNSVLSDILEKERLEFEGITASPQDSLLRVSASSCSDMDSDADLHVGIISISQILREKKTRKEARRFLENMQKDLNNMREKTKTYKDSLDEATATLTDVRFHSIEEAKSAKNMSNVKIVIIIALIFVVFPIILYLNRHYLYNIEHSGR